LLPPLRRRARIRDRIRYEGDRMALPPTGPNPPSRRALHVTLWIAQILLAVAFGFAGFLKLTQPIASLAGQMPWTTSVPWWLVRFIGLSEFAAMVGLILPAATRIRPVLTPLAAMGLVVIMAMAAAFHLSRGEAGVVPMNGMFAALAAFVAWGRFVKRPISPRT
jgi:hypothetical protein